MAAPATRCPVHAEFDPLGEEYLRDPFAHGRLRKPAARAFTPRRVNEIRAELLDAVDPTAPFESAQA